MTYPEFRELEEEIKAAAFATFQLHCDEELLFKFFWYGVEAKAIGSEEDACPFKSGKTRGAYLAGMEWYENHSQGNDSISPERIAALSSGGQ